MTNKVSGVSRAMLAAVAVLCAASSAARAEKDRVVLEMYTSERPADADAVLGPVYAELGKRGYVHGAALIDDVNASLSRDGGALSASQVIELQKQVDDAYQRFIDGDYALALTPARAALAAYASAPGQMAREPALRALRYKALIVAARSSEASDKGEDAFALMAEAIRSFPERTINPAEFAPNVAALYRRVKADLAKQGVGTLEVNVDDPAATIYVDEQLVATGTARLERLAPGTYRVFIAKAQHAGRVRDVTIATGATTTVNVTWSIDGALRTRGRSVALALDNGTGGDAELLAATQLGRALGATSVVVLSARPINGRRAIVGYSINVESQNKTFAAIQIEPIAPTPGTLVKLAALLAGDKGIAGPGLITTEPVERPIGELDRPTRGLGAKRWTSLILGGFGIAAFAGAVAFEVSSSSSYDKSKIEPDDVKQNALYESANRKYKLAQGFALSGAVLAVGAATLWFTGGYKSERRDGVSLVPTPSSGGFSVVVSGRF